MTSSKQAEAELSQTLGGDGATTSADEPPFDTKGSKAGDLNGEPIWVWNSRGGGGAYAAGAPDVPGLHEEYRRLWDERANIDKSQYPFDPNDPDSEFDYMAAQHNAGETVYDSAGGFVAIVKGDPANAAPIDLEGSSLIGGGIIYFETKPFDMGNGYYAVAGVSGV